MTNTTASATRTLTTVTGRTATLPETLDITHVVGLDYRGRIVVDHFNALNAPANPTGNFSDEVFVFGLTLCCTASDTGVESGVVCRGCYGDETTGDDVGHYIYRDADGGWSGLDRVASIA